jgi:hypothetical protein
VKEHYLNILGLSGSTSEADIKKAFRKKALLYHPDRNPSEDAQKQFILICEAYEWLTNPNARTVKSKTTYYQQPQKTKEEELEERLKRAREILRRRAVEEKLRMQTDFSKFKKSFIYKTSLPIYITSIIMAFTLIYDHFGTPKTISGYINSTEVYKRQLHISFNTEQGDKLFRIYQYNSIGLNPKKYAKYQLNITPVLSSFISVSVNDKEYDNLHSIHYIFWLLIFFLLAPIVSIFYQKPTTESYLLMHLNYFIPIIILIAILFF